MMREAISHPVCEDVCEQKYVWSAQKKAPPCGGVPKTDYILTNAFPFVKSSTKSSR